jgi:energy-converting hydrogenase A subunit P
MFDYLSLFERLVPPDQSKVSLQPARCLHATNRFSACTSCFELCPVDAIHAGKPPALDAERCVNCLACVAVCPVGAFSAKDAVTDLLESAARLETGVIELLCAPHSQGELGLAASNTAVRVKGCLAGLGPGAYLALARLGFTQAIVRTDACAGCAWGNLYPQVESQVTQAKQILQAWGRADFLISTDVKTGLVKRPVFKVDEPAISRREMFHFVSNKGKSAVGRLVHEQPARKDGKFSPNRLRTLNAVTGLLADAPQEDPRLPGSGFALAAVSEACSACGVCARTCPTGAIRFINEKDVRYQLLFLPRDCVNCQACVTVCLPKALTLEDSPSFSQVFKTQGLMLLSQGELIRCTSCNVLFTPKEMEKLCPICQRRQKNVNGPVLPPGSG